MRLLDGHVTIDHVIYIQSCPHMTIYAPWSSRAHLSGTLKATNAIACGKIRRKVGADFYGTDDAKVAAIRSLLF